MHKCLSSRLIQKIKQIQSLLFGFVAIVFALALMAPCCASPPRQSIDSEAPEAVVAELKRDLELTDEQADLIYPIIERQTKRRNAILKEYRAKGRSARGGMRLELEALQQESETQLAEILSESQMKAYRRLQEQRRDQMGRRFGRPF